MELAHATYEKGYETILPLLDSPPERDLKNFLGYCEAWGESIVHHHDTEEASVFLILNKKMDFSHEQEQHKEVHSFLDNFLAKIRSAQKDNSNFNAAELKQLMQSSKEAMFTHFSEELVHIEASKLREAGFTEAECRQLITDMEKHAKNNGDPFLVVPYMRSHTPPEYKDIWPPMPWILRKVAVPYLLAKKHSGYWKYAPYAMS
ncbi:uncharacterized protein PHACADRAFT_259303 [Phanerochaete carnosa HHB-10118-sp]|uniref:Hemerythrin-like domain-containing protein n=1 Tax=Phanerochaete carnosa (strain HHB-10118-sp) TaxID=650164 RepID=K5VNS0_PHACS|nr:uncharacterized protein PHACADRAFT_259303 [Phanerochaete carnosa HHB-10118-sp]EKM53128.1 hypothetical protein PHACADRAFT_259303 [Phanerochaete carnosa HHB-10118-sp]